MDDLYEFMVLELAYRALASEERETRALGTDLLAAAGDRARPWLERGCTSTDEHVMRQCKQLLKELPSAQLSNAEEVARIGRRMRALVSQPEQPSTRGELEKLSKRAAELFGSAPGDLHGWRDHTLAALRMFARIERDKNMPDGIRERARELYKELVAERDARNAEPRPVIREDAENAEVQPSEDEDPNAVREREAEDLGRRDERDDD